jgi:hypothetical protein
MQRCHHGISQTAERSVTRMSDKDPKTKKENELDPNTQLEKLPFTGQLDAVVQHPLCGRSSRSLQLHQKMGSQCPLCGQSRHSPRWGLILLCGSMCD